MPPSVTDGNHPKGTEIQGVPEAINPIGKLRVLAVIANFGTKNDNYLRQVLDEYAAMSHRVHVTVLTNISKDLGPSVEVLVRQPSGDPWSFPFAHKQILADRIRDYDLFIYSEDDTLITEKNVDAFLKVTAALPKNEIAGFLRSEKGRDGSTYFSTVHNHFHWDPHSVVSRGAHTLAFFTNEHAAAYLLTRAQLQRAIDSGGFLCGPHQEKYDLLVSAATDPYTRCGMRKLIPISHLQDFVLPHLPSKYIGIMGLREEEVRRQVRALLEIHDHMRPSSTLLDREARAAQGKWDKKYYEPVRQDLLKVLPPGVQSVLTYGCGWGALEQELSKRGLDVTAIPLDAVIGATAEARGIRVVYGSPREALEEVSQKRFDCIVVTNILHLYSNPKELLSSFVPLLAPQGTILGTIPNLQQLPVRLRRLRGEESYRSLSSFEQAGVQLASKKMIREWFQSAGLKITRTIPVIPDRAKQLSGMLGKISPGMLASEFLILARKADSGD